MIPDIASALAARLGAWADAEGILVAWENVPFTPPANEMYLAVHDICQTADNPRRQPSKRRVFESEKCDYGHQLRQL